MRNFGKHARFIGGSDESVPDGSGAVETTGKRKNPDFGGRTRKYFQDRGWHFARVEYYNAFSGQKADLWGFGDALAFRRSFGGCVAVQYTSRSGILMHIRKACANDSGGRYNKNPGVVLVDWLLSGNRFVVIGWRKVGRLWQATIVEVTPSVVEAVQRGDRLFIAKLPVVSWL